MKCTDCGHEVKPIVALDIDGTLGQYHQHFLEFADAYCNTTFLKTYNGLGEMHESMGISLEAYRQIKLAYRQGGGKRMMPVYPGAYWLTWRLRDKAEVWLTTTRPYNKFDSTDPDTLHWLERNKIQWDHLLYDGNKYTELASRVDPARVVAVIDDLYDPLMEAAKVFPNALVAKRQTQFNTAWVWEGRTITDLREIDTEIQLQIRAWHYEHRS